MGFDQHLVQYNTWKVKAIAIVSAVDLVQDFFVLQEQFDYLINYLDEAIEMLVGIAGFLYVWLNAKLFKFQ